MRVAIALALLGMTAGIATASGGALDYPSAQEVAARARALQAEGRGADADALLARRSGDCAAAEEGRSCRLLLEYTRGVVAERRAGVEAADAANLLRAAAGHYQRVLDDEPLHPAALRSLARVYRRLNAAPRAEALLRQAADQRPDDEVLGVLLGDFYRDERRWDAARDAYARTAERAPGAEAPRRRLVELYADLPPKRLPELAMMLPTWETSFPSVAEAGYRLALAHAQALPPQVAETSLIRLVGVLARSRRISIETLADVAPGWSSPALAELRAYVGAPPKSPPPRWWLGTSARRQALGEVALALGHERLLAGDPAGAAARWETAVHVAPGFDEYDSGALRDQNMVRLDLLTELASLYYKFPRLDPGGQRFEASLNLLFQSKGDAYRARDLRAIQRHHTILGTIFAQTGRWSGPAPFNALFQLEHALQAAAELDRREETYQPLPELRALLGDARRAVGDGARAHTAYLAAAAAYLDADALDQAAEMLKRADAQQAAAPASERTRRDQLEVVLQTRRAVEGAAGAALDPRAPGYAFRADGASAWLHGTSLAALPADFVQRQRFKTLADLSARSREAGQAEAAETYAAEAFRAAEEGGQRLTGPADLVRLKRLVPQATQNRTGALKPVSVAPRATAPSATAPSAPAATPARPAPAGKTWTVPLGTRSAPAAVTVDPDDVLDARIKRELKKADPGAADVPYRVQGGRVQIPDSPKARDVKPILERVPGVKGVTVTPPRR